MIYGKRSNGKEHGTVLTKAVVVEKMLDLVAYKADTDLSSLAVIDPAVGEGAFALPLMRRLYASSKNHGFDFINALANLRFFDVDAAALKRLKERILQEFDFLSEKAVAALLRCEDFLTAEVEICDLIIGNPPYVRHEQIPVLKKAAYKKLFGTFVQRSDIYVAFYEKGLKLLKKEGRLSFLSSNRWLKNQYGRQLRQFITNAFCLEYLIDLEEAEVFEENVIAYPAIASIQNKKSSSSPPYYKVDTLADLLKFSTDQVPTRRLSSNPNNWFTRHYSWKGQRILLSSIAEQGFDIGIGVATGRDKIFIRKDLHEHVEKELLLPILVSKDVRAETIQWTGHYFLNPYEENGALIELEKYPKAKTYLHQHREELLKRHIAQKNPKNWYRTIDKVHPQLMRRPKIILPDITGNPLVHIDKGHYYPHHNLYYITGQDFAKLELLAALLMSDFIREQLGELGNKMNGGYPRWQSQNLKKLKIPYMDSIPVNSQEALRKAYQAQDIEQINALISLRTLATYERTEGQLALFEPKYS